MPHVSPIPLEFPSDTSVRFVSTRDGQGEVERIQAKIAWTPSCAGPETVRDLGSSESGSGALGDLVSKVHETADLEHPVWA